MATYILQAIRQIVLSLARVMVIGGTSDLNDRLQKTLVI